jgi:uracil-DNA glycosylase
MDKQFVSNDIIITKMFKDQAVMAIAGNAGLVPSEGKIGAEVMFVGESPTKLNTELGRPFMGMGGSILNSILADSGLKRDDVYITNVVR